LPATTQQDCSGVTVRVEAWIDAVSVWDCLTDTKDALENCVNENANGNAGVTLISNNCGQWNGRSNHKYISGGTTTTVQPGRTTPLDGGSCAPPVEDCSEYGPDWYWNGYYCTNAASPIIIPTRRGGDYKLTSASEGVLFDLNDTGVPQQVAWTAPNSDLAFLAIDLDGDGRITSGRELFGNHTIPGVLSGFEALARMARESNGGIMRGSVSSDDPLFSRLLLWTDRNHDGISEPDELRPASEILSEIGLGYSVSMRRDEFGNTFLYKGWAHERTRPGRNQTNSKLESQERLRTIWDVFLTKQE
jgi:hypothetical protein